MPKAWLVRLADRAITVHRTPIGGSYQDEQTHQPGQTIDLSIKTLTAVAVDEILG